MVTRFLVNANLAGVDSHGVTPNLIIYLQGVRSGTIKPRAKIEVRADSPSTALVDGKWGFGQMACSKAMEVAIDKAGRTGVGAVGVFNCNHIGRLAEYAQMAAASGMIGFITANCEPYVAPYGGRTPVLGTNPLSYAIPAGHQKAVVVDYATSAAAEGKVRAALFRGEQLPSGWIVDSHGPHPQTRQICTNHRCLLSALSWEEPCCHLEVTRGMVWVWLLTCWLASLRSGQQPRYDVRVVN